MSKNVGSTDKTIRFIAAIILLVIGVIANVGVSLKIIIFALSAINFITALFGTCPLYSIIGISTNKSSK